MTLPCTYRHPLSTPLRSIHSTNEKAKEARGERVLDLDLDRARTQTRYAPYRLEATSRGAEKKTGVEGAQSPAAAAEDGVVAAASRRSKNRRRGRGARDCRERWWRESAGVFGDFGHFGDLGHLGDVGAV